MEFLVKNVAKFEIRYSHGFPINGKTRTDEGRKYRAEEFRRNGEGDRDAGKPGMPAAGPWPGTEVPAEQEGSPSRRFRAASAR